MYPIYILDLRPVILLHHDHVIQSIDRGDKVASLSVKERIKEMVRREDKSRPYSDHEIANILKRSNIDIARRTVAKYREVLRILTAESSSDQYPCNPEDTLMGIIRST